MHVSLDTSLGPGWGASRASLQRDDRNGSSGPPAGRMWTADPGSRSGDRERFLSNESDRADANLPPHLGPTSPMKSRHCRRAALQPEAISPATSPARKRQRVRRVQRLPACRPGAPLRVIHPLQAIQLIEACAQPLHHGPRRRPAHTSAGCATVASRVPGPSPCHHRPVRPAQSCQLAGQAHPRTAAPAS